MSVNIYLKEALNGGKFRSIDNIKRALFDVSVLVSIALLNQYISIPREVNIGAGIVFIPEFFRQLRIFGKKKAFLNLTISTF